jgi:XTP/dITP diphosphohydrolase
MKLLVATRNRGKLAELERLLGGLDLELCTLDDVGDTHEVVEDGATFEANAIKKAREHAERNQLPTLADDSGLEVDALDGAPGVISARYAGVDGSAAVRDPANNQKLLAALEAVYHPHRSARFRCVLALVTPSGQIRTARGAVEGQIIRTPRGTMGFGYDPLFIPVGETRTMAELPAGVKNRISHRARAALEMRPLLVGVLDR